MLENAPMRRNRTCNRSGSEDRDEHVERDTHYLSEGPVSRFHRLETALGPSGVLIIRIGCSIHSRYFYSGLRRR